VELPLSTALLPYLSTAAALGFSAGALPGPFQAYLLSQALRHGWRRAALLALAPLLSDGPVILVVLLLLARLPVWTLHALQVAGGVFILFLAWNAWRGLKSAEDAARTQEIGRGLDLLRAATINLLSPGVYLFWATISGPLFLQGWREGPALGLAFLLCFYGTMIGLTEILVAVMGALRRLGPRLRRSLLIISIVLLVILALRQISVGLGALLG
jgi:threonine/homoserine/homoserine lactone efflux protein